MKRKILQMLTLAAAVLAIGVGVVAPVGGQSFINRITGPGVLDNGGAVKMDNDGELLTYSATAVNLVPPSSATDLSCLIGSSTKTVRVTRVVVSGTAGTLVTLPVNIMKHSVVPTPGTPVIGATAPVVVKHISSQTAATAVPTAWTTTPVLNDIATLYSQTLTLPVTSAGTSSSRLESTWGGRGGSRAPVLSGTSQYLCVHLNGVSVSSGLVTTHFEWTEE